MGRAKQNTSLNDECVPTLYNADVISETSSKFCKYFLRENSKSSDFFLVSRQFVVFRRCLESGSSIGCHISWDHLTIKTQKYTDIHILNLKRGMEFMILTVSLCNSYLYSSKYRAEI